MTRGGSVAIVEAEPGSGKTEAAVTTFFEMRRSDQVRGMYFALPTRTSAVQIHRRISRAVAARFAKPPPVVLAVPGYMRVGDEDGKLVGHTALWDDDGIARTAWAAENAKRYLAAAIAVGTIDQVLLSVLDVKHGSMRWAAFAKSLLVVDEVHASDTYMGTLLEEVVRRHVARGGHALLMSATLGSSLARRCLVAADPTATRPLPSLREAVDLPYPLYRRVSPGTADVVKGVSSNGYVKVVHPVLDPILADPEAIARLAAYHVRRGAKVLVVRNTVAGCNAVHRCLEALVGPDRMMRVGGVSAPHHGRFSPEDRRLLDAAVEETFGKGTPSRGVVLCATQTVEQSLDIDADVVLCDLCPMDILLQRIGRLHRHLVDGLPKPRPPGYEVPVVHVLVPSHPISHYAARPGNGIGWDRAYQDLSVVAATAGILAVADAMRIPDENRSLVERSCHPEAIGRIEVADPILGDYGIRLRGRSLAERDVARLGVRSPDWRYGDPLNPMSDDARIATRLGESDRIVALDKPFRSPLGSITEYVRIPAWLAKGFDVPISVSGIDGHDRSGNALLSIGKRRFSYGRCGFEPGAPNERIDEPAS